MTRNWRPSGEHAQLWAALWRWRADADRDRRPPRGDFRARTYKELALGRGVHPACRRSGARSMNHGSSRCRLWPWACSTGARRRAVRLQRARRQAVLQCQPNRARFDALIVLQRAEARLARQLRPEERPEAKDALPPWHVHDLRKTVATGLQRLGVRLEVDRGCPRARFRQPQRHRGRLPAPQFHDRGPRGAGRLGCACAAADRQRHRQRRGGAAAPRIELPSWGRLGLAAESGFRSHPPAAPSHPANGTSGRVRHTCQTAIFRRRRVPFPWG